MMFSQSMLTAGLSVMASLAVASPIQDTKIHARQAIQKQDAPAYCLVEGNERAALPGAYVDVSQDCQDAGLGNECCMTFLDNGKDVALTDEDIKDLMAVIAAQSKKDGKFKTTKQGDWTASYAGIFTSHDLIDSQLLQVWFHVLLNDLNLPGTAGLGDVILQIHQGTGDISNYMRIDRAQF